jgi:hypothetical protein
VNPSELAFGAALVPVLIGLACYFGWRQVRTLRSLRAQPELSREDQLYLRGQARRRLACSVLMLALAGMLVGYYFLDATYREVRQERAAETAREGEDAAVQPEHKAFLQQFAAYWILFLLLLMTMLVLVAVDVWAIAKFGQRHHRQLRAELQATLAHEVARLRHRHNGQQN